MNLAAIVGRAMHALPAGVRGTCTITRKQRGTRDVTTDVRTDGALLTLSNVPCVVEAVKEDMALPPGLTPARARIVTVAAVDCTTFTPAGGDTITTANGLVFDVIGPLTVDPTGGAPALHQLLVRE